MNLKTMDTNALHQFVLGYNWDEGDRPMLQAARHPECDLGTAILIYWLAEPTYYFVEYADRKEVPADGLAQWDFLVEIERRVAEAFYRSHKFRIDPANFDGQDLTELAEGESFKRAIPAQMFGPDYSGPRPRAPRATPKEIRRMDSQQLHQFASGYHWIDGVDLLNEVVDNPKCDGGTALMVYWHLGPHRFDDRANSTEVSEIERGEYRLMKKLERRFTRGAYQQKTIAYDPADDMGTNWTRDDFAGDPKKRVIPRIMYHPIRPGPVT